MIFPKTLTLAILAMGLVFALSAWAQQKPFTQEQVSNMVRAGLRDDSGAKLIEQCGIDFAPSEDFCQTLTAAGASEAFLKVLRAAKPPEPASAKKPLNQVQVFALLVGQVPSHRVTMLVQERGIDFEPTDDYLQEVRLAGGEDELISALKSAKVTKPVTVDPAVQAREDTIRQHVAQGAELAKKGQFAEAEQEYRAALILDSQDPNLYVSLAYVLGQEKKLDDSVAAGREAVRLAPNDYSARAILGDSLVEKDDWGGAISEYREAVRLDPNNYWAHDRLGSALGKKGELDGAIAEFREELRLNPNSAEGHGNLSVALERKGDLDGAITEAREALRLNPNLEGEHRNLGIFLGEKGDLDGAIAEYREALRLNPTDEHTHFNLGMALKRKGDWDGVVAEERAVLSMNPNNASAHYMLGFALSRKHDLDGAIAEFREALRSKPDDDETHTDLGIELGHKGDRDGAVAEYREAVSLNPNNAWAHDFLGLALEGKGERQGALKEYRAAYTLDPKNTNFKQNYERLLQQVNK